MDTYGKNAVSLGGRPALDDRQKNGQAVGWSIIGLCIFLGAFTSGNMSATFFVTAFLVFLFIAVRFSPNPVKEMEKSLATMEECIGALDGFTPALRYDSVASQISVILDPDTNQFAIAAPGRPVRVSAFDQLVGVDVERNGSALQKTNRGSQMVGAAVGGVLLGPLGMLMGGLSGSTRNEETVKRLSLKLYTNDLHNPATEIVFFHHKAGLKPDAKPVKLAAQQLDDWSARFQTVLRTQQREEQGSGFGRRIVGSAS